MSNGDPFASSSSEIPLTAMLDESVQAHREQLAKRLRSAGSGGTLPQRAKAMARVLVEGLPVDVACFFLNLSSNVIYTGGAEWLSTPRSPGKMTLRQPNQTMRHRLERLALMGQGQREAHIHRAARNDAAWRAHLVVPLANVEGAIIGHLVLGRRKRDFAADDLATLAGLRRLLSSALSAGADLPTEPASLPPAVLQAFFQATDDAFLLIEPDFTIRALNPAFHALTGWNAAIIGQRCQDILRCHDDEGIPFCGTVQCPLYAAKPVSSAANQRTAARIGGGEGQAECEVEIGSVALNGGNTPTRALLLRASGHVAGGDASRDRFLTDLAHRLRNRFNSINGFMELVAMDHQHPVTAGQRQMLSMAHNSSLELLEYIENLLYLTRRDAGQAPLLLDMISAGDLLEEVEQHLTLEASAVPLRLVRDAPDDLPPLRCDRTRLRQAVMNLVTNAIKFTPPNGMVRLSARAAKGALVITVADTGIGIAPEDQPHIFARDYAVERTGRMGKNGGGMGLAAALAIVEQHGGTLSFTSKVERGTTFTIRLPLA